MNQQTASGTLEKIREIGLLAVVRGASCAAAVDVSRALVEGGITGIEVAFTTPEADKALQELSEEYGDRILLGAGTVTTHGHVEKALSSGARFLVSPGCDHDLLPAMQESGLAVMPGVLTPSEVISALRFGAEVVKLFPGSLGGPGYLKALRGPFPEVAFLPTGGVSEDNVREWFGAGAFAVGVGGALAPKSLEGKADRARLIERAGRLAKVVRRT